MFFLVRALQRLESKEASKSSKLNGPTNKNEWTNQQKTVDMICSELFETSENHSFPVSQEWVWVFKQVSEQAFNWWFSFATSDGFIGTEVTSGGCFHRQWIYIEIYLKNCQMEVMEDVCFFFMLRFLGIKCWYISGRWIKAEDWAPLCTGLLMAGNAGLGWFWVRTRSRNDCCRSYMLALLFRKE